MFDLLADIADVLLPALAVLVMVGAVLLFIGFVATGLAGAH